MQRKERKKKCERCGTISSEVERAKVLNGKMLCVGCLVISILDTNKETEV